MISHLESLLNTPIIATQKLTGGDTASVFKLETDSKDYVLKLSTNEKASAMFKAEAFGLKSIAQTNTIKTPEVIGHDTFDSSSFLILEFIESRTGASNDFALLGSQLAKLHQHGVAQFGLSQDNFIGSLAQINTQSSNWTDFYVEHRLLYQMNLAVESGKLSHSEIPSIKSLKTVLKPLFEHVKPALLHGDLWSGNYLFSKDGLPYLIDPAVYYGHSEVDIAMSKLFGGFHDAFYEAYHDVHPKTINASARLDIYQLYFLLVHLNLFGSSYYGSVKRILNTYF
ncbi:fructosamine kinase family protein [Winogradskyella aurantia]|uniref:fructosamine kinase family protein n=1 Tax=Winogradskyella aurantia TaxID=1915063 RepID=UPI0013FD919A|nr:fructosamine kinase family protein [Winogradskyella aurantia]